MRSATLPSTRITLAAACALALHFAMPTSLIGQVAILADRVYPVSSPVIDKGLILINGDGRITFVGPAADQALPKDVEVLRAKVAIPGLVDAHSVVGLAGHLNHEHDQDQLDRSAAMQPELRAIDAYNGRERLVEWIRGLGVTTLHTGHAPGAVISGQTCIVKTDAPNADRAVRRETAMVASTIGTLAVGKDGPGTMGKLVAVFRERFQKVVELRQAEVKDPNSEEVKKASYADQILLRVLKGEIPLLITAHRADEILTAIRLKNEFGFKMVLDGAAEAHLVLDQIKAAQISVIVHPPMARTFGPMANATFELASIVDRAGIPFAFQSGFEDYVPKTRVVLFEAGMAAARGLGFDRALFGATLGAARILGMDERVGSLEVGKDGDVALYDGDPFEPTSHCVGVIIEGRVVSREVR
ncbi:MAG TPA: amidohydrolase family protein [Planctomycetota bacterium]|nr:amidohydrolase family protein [Planctomycetota bacterium]